MNENDNLIEMKEEINKLVSNLDKKNILINKKFNQIFSNLEFINNKSINLNGYKKFRNIRIFKDEKNILTLSFFLKKNRFFNLKGIIYRFKFDNSLGIIKFTPCWHKINFNENYTKYKNTITLLENFLSIPNLEIKIKQKIKQELKKQINFLKQ